MSLAMRRVRSIVWGALVLGAASAASAQPPVAPPPPPTQIPQTKFARGQDVVPYYEGWIRNADGSFDIVFGYFNRNWEEALLVPAGLDNDVEPGGPDRGQPTFFAPRRQGWVFRVRVPQDWGMKPVTWTLTAHGRTEKVVAELLPVEEITERIVSSRGNLSPGEGDPNKPPALAIAPVREAAAAMPVTLAVSVTDDGLPKPRQPKPTATAPSPSTTLLAQTNSAASTRPRGLTLGWLQLRGPAPVAVDDAGPVSISNGTTTTAARFGTPGTYVLRAIASDGALSTTADVTIVVSPRSATEGR